MKRLALYGMAVVMGGLPQMVVSQQIPATQPAATAPATQKEPTGSMVFDFQDAPVDSVLNALSENFGLTIIRSQPVPGRITVVSRGVGGRGLNQEQAIEVTNSLLFPLGFGIMETSESIEGKPLYRVSTTSEMKKAAPVGVFRN